MSMNHLLLAFIVLLMPSIASAQADHVEVCLIDPAAPQGFRMQEARLLNASDTVINLRVADRLIQERVPVAMKADWYINGKPLLIGTGADSIDLFTYGSPRAFTSGQLVILGVARGMPIYADLRNASLALQEIAKASRGNRNRDLGEILAESKTVRERVDRIGIFYVPLSVVGCVFQAVIRGEDSRN